MKISISIECKCGTVLNLAVNTSDGLMSITTNINQNFFGFKAKQTCPDDTTITCLGCGRHIELSI